jgi:hypothetical protein
MHNTGHCDVEQNNEDKQENPVQRIVKIYLGIPSVIVFLEKTDHRAAQGSPHISYCLAWIMQKTNLPQGKKNYARTIA